MTKDFDSSGNATIALDNVLDELDTIVNPTPEPLTIQDLQVSKQLLSF